MLSLTSKFAKAVTRLHAYLSLDDFLPLHPLRIRTELLQLPLDFWVVTELRHRRFPQISVSTIRGAHGKADPNMSVLRVVSMRSE